ncbi:hypothetical protein F443_11677 [Phytophthora nicotianae P1569]|uniref:EF-hand domain-containing protein n=1 Tax=Phytophthora nicotianae P1569 TaxID=1317065 RepID=V9EXV5_PHYNI|nr:hypothetical protein F443_11677 [Phytophthora nicotianae P1569]
MKESMEGAWTATQVRAMAAKGLASSHLQPFVRLLYNDPRRVSGDRRRSRTILVESRDTDDVVCRRQRERNGKYTVVWKDVGDCEAFNVHSVVDWVELQLWNHFDNGFDVFLGKASVSLHQLHEQAMANENKSRDALSTGALWFPLQTSETNGLASRLSLEIECVFTLDPKVLHIREAISKNRENASAKASDEDNGLSIVDPAFAFTQPFLPVDWASIASTSVRHLFFHSDIERLANFRELVLYGDLEKELDEDEGLQIHNDHLTAFNLCQFSAQYLDHCVETLSQRLEGYSDDYRALVDTKARLTRKNKALKAQRKRLQKEHDDLDLLITTYQRVLEKNGDTKVPSDPLSQPNSPCAKSPPVSPPLSPTGSISAKKPVFLKTWEERERERRMEKEISKAQRIEEEKQRIIQRVLERQQREEYDALFSKFTENRKQRAAQRIQAFFRDIRSALDARQQAAENRGATCIQAAWKRFVHLKEYPRRLEARKQEVEMLLMVQSEREMRQWMDDMEKKREEDAARAMSPPESIKSNEAVDDPSPSASPSKQVVDALVATWRKLHRVFVLAHQSKGIDYQALFDEIDLRKDDVIDRAELRLGARSFGVRLDRKITRALITLIRTKCGVPSKPLLMTFDQFMTGFELMTQIEASPGNLYTSNLEHSVADNIEEIKLNDVAEGTPINDASQDKEEDLVMAVRAFRAAVYDSATRFLAAQGKPPTDYKAFRDALAHVFSRFDADRNGQLDVDELVACMSSFNLQLSNEKISLLRELFVGDRDSDKVGVAEFISFVLAHSSSSDEDELGLLGHRIRETIMIRVREAQAQTESVEAAVRLVFGAAYKRQDQQKSSIRDFMRAMNRLRLGVTPAQLARLVVRLDRDGDRSISFDELLIWLRIRSKPTLDDDILAYSERSTGLQLAIEKAKEVRVLLDKLASLASPTAESKTSNLTALFYQIDRNNSGKINQEELQMFLRSQDLLSIVGEEVLTQLCGLPTMPQHPAAVVAQEMMILLDLNANGVTTLKEWLTFAQHDTAQGVDDPVVIDAMRKTLRESENNDPERLVLWFSELPGALQAATTRQGEPAQMKIRVAEFKTAMRAKLGGARSISLQTLDRVVGSLDKDSSGWVTTSELCAWAFPSRDLEELLRLVIKCWQGEHQQSSRRDLATNLFARFDVDGNGTLAVRELRQGFETFGLVLSEYETQVLLIAFDLDGDGCWGKSDFLTFVNKLLPIESADDPAQHTVETSDSPSAHESPRNGDDIPADGAYREGDQLLEPESSNGLSSAYSDEGEDSVRPIDYSEDFAED